MADCVVVHVLASPGMDDWLLLNDGLSVNSLHRCLRVRAIVHTVVRYVHQDGTGAATDGGQSSVTRDTSHRVTRDPPVLRRAVLGCGGRGGAAVGVQHGGGGRAVRGERVVGVGLELARSGRHRARAWHRGGYITL